MRLGSLSLIFLSWAGIANAKRGRGRGREGILDGSGTGAPKGPNSESWGYLAKIPCEVSLKDYEDLKFGLRSLAQRLDSYYKKIKYDSRNRRKRHSSLPLPLGKHDWTLLKEYLPPIIDVMRGDLKRANAPHTSIHQVKRLLTFADSGKQDALFSTEATKYLKVFFRMLSHLLMNMNYKDYISNVKSRVPPDAALELLDDLYESEDKIIPDYYELEKWL